MPDVTTVEVRSKSIGFTEVRSLRNPLTANAITKNPITASAKAAAIRGGRGRARFGVNKAINHISTAKIPVTATGGICSGRRDGTHEV